MLSRGCRATPNYNIKTYFIGGIGIFPIAGIRTKPPMNFTQDICNYTDKGRKIIHKNLQCT